MQIAETRKSGHGVVNLGVVLHGAGTKRIEAGVDAVIELAETNKMSDTI